VRALTLLVVLLTAAPVFAREGLGDSAFWRAWGDGKAELDGYALVRPRYGELRTGTVVAVFVTEPWSLSAHVKADDVKAHPASDVIQALKLNLVEDFQTGIYDYNLMTSAWTAIPAGTTPKVAFSSQEWCGTTYTDLVFEGASAAETVRSYFDGETGMHTLATPTGPALVEDSLLVWARDLAAPFSASTDARVNVAFLPSLARARLLHKPLAWTRATLTRSSASTSVDVPAGHFAVHRVHVDVAAVPGGEGARTIDIDVEDAPPRRIIALRASDGYALALTGTLRTAYWMEHSEGDEKLLEQLGLHPPRSR
jgi:hypothetical protein